VRERNINCDATCRHPADCTHGSGRYPLGQTVDRDPQRRRYASGATRSLTADRRPHRCRRAQGANCSSSTFRNEA
jgi:hypothetical protein